MDKAENIISELFNIKDDGKNSPYSPIFKNWKYIIPDKRLSDHCRIEDINVHQLIVSFDHQGWIQVFKMHQRQIINNINRYLKNEKISSVRMIMRSEKGKYLNREQNSGLQLKKAKENGEKVVYSGDIDSIHDEELKKHLENLKKTLQGN